MPADGINRCRSSSEFRQLPPTALGDITPRTYICGGRLTLGPMGEAHFVSSPTLYNPSTAGCANPKRIDLHTSHNRSIASCTLQSSRPRANCFFRFPVQQKICPFGNF